MEIKPIFERDYFLKYLEYRRNEGRFYWKMRSKEEFPCERTFNAWRSNFYGKLAGGTFSTGSDDTRIKFHLKGHSFCNYRVVAVVEGIIPHYNDPRVIDHLDGEPGNDFYKNLRACDRNTNMRNIKRNKLNKSGITGVSRHTINNTWIVTMGVHGTETWKWQCEKTLFEAACVRRSWELEAGYTKRHI